MNYRSEFMEILERQNGMSFPCTPVPADFQHSRTTTPSGYGDYCELCFVCGVLSLLCHSLWHFIFRKDTFT